VVARTKPEAPGGRRSLARVGLEILGVLARHSAGVGISDLAKAVGLEVAQAHRTVRDLVTAGWVVQDRPNGPYGLTGKVLALAASQLQHSELREVALPVLRGLRQRTGETIVLAEFRSGRLYCIARELADASVISWAQVGDSWPLGSPAAMSLAVESAITSTGLDALFPADYSPTPERVEELELCAERGWSLDDSQYRARGCAVGAPVLDFESRPVGAIAIAWPRDRVDDSVAGEFGPAVRAAAEEVSSLLGFRRVDPAAPWRTIADARGEDLLRHLSDLRTMTYEGAAGRERQVEVFDRAARLLSPVVEEVMAAVSDQLELGLPSIARIESDSPAEGRAVRWSLSWPEQQAARIKVTGEPLAPVSVVARLRPVHIHGHLGGSYFGDWPMQIVSPEDAQRQATVVLAIIEAEFHQRIFETGGDWRLIPLYRRRVGEATLVGLTPEHEATA
jgi:DNA-binding IclR family transcriptional regulator